MCQLPNWHNAPVVKRFYLYNNRIIKTRSMPYFDPGNGTQVFIPESNWNRGTYRELLAILAELPEENLDQEVVIFDHNNDDFISAGNVGWTGPASKIGNNKFFITVN